MGGVGFGSAEGKGKDMKLCKKDVNDLMQVVYWASAVRTDAEALSSGKCLGQSEDYYSNIVRCVNELDACAQRVLLGENRKTKSGQ